MERKYMNSNKVQSKESELVTYWSGTLGDGTNIQSKQACVIRYKSQSKTRAKPEEPVCRSSEKPLGIKNPNNAA